MKLRAINPHDYTRKMENGSTVAPLLVLDRDMLIALVFVCLLETSLLFC